MMLLVMPRLTVFLVILGAFSLDLHSTEFTENNAAAWGAFASDSAAVSVRDDATRVRVGTSSIRFATTSGFDTGVRYPAAATAHWDARTNTHLVFWTFADNTNGSGFQGNQPIVVLKTAGGSYRYEPASNETYNRVWAYHRVPLTGDARWRRTTTGAPTLADVNQVEIHQDTWDYGFIIYYDGMELVSIAPGGVPPPGPLPPPGVNPDLVRPRILFFAYDPIMENRGGKRMHEVYRWGDPVVLTAGIVRDFRSNSHGLFLPNIVETRSEDGYWYHKDGFIYDDASYNQAVTTGTYHASGFDYVRFIADNGIAPRVLSGDLDEVWLYQGVGAGTWESTMAGDGGYWCNSSPVQGVPSERLFVVMGWNFERGVGEAIHSYGHRTESIMVHSYKQWVPSRANNWSAFALLDKDAPGLGGVGNVHYPVNALHDYEYGSAAVVVSSADDWYNYPNFTGLTRAFNSTEWSPTGLDTQRDYLNWWYRHLPHFPGRAPDGFLNNWWRYIVDPEQFKGSDGNLTGTLGIPSVSIPSPAGGATVSGVIQVRASAFVDGALGRVDFYVDDTYQSSDTLAPYSFDWDTRGLLGPHTLVAKAYELQNGTESTSAPVMVNVETGRIRGTVLDHTTGVNGVTLTAHGQITKWNRWTATNSLPIPNNDVGGVTSDLNIAATGQLARVQVGLTVAHPRRSDLEVWLVSPGGTSVRLHNRSGDNEPNLITFYPDLADPDQSLGSLLGQDIAGLWQLIMKDRVEPNAGQLLGWSLALTYTQELTFTSQSASDGSYALNDLPAGAYTITPSQAGRGFFPLQRALTIIAGAQTADFVLSTNFPPSIVSPPQGQRVVAGSNASFAVIAAGTPPLGYQWQFNGTNLPNATNTSLMLTNVQFSQAGAYRVIVGSLLGMVTSPPATLTVLPTPFPADAAEGNAADWGTFASDNAATSVSNDTTRVRLGVQSVRFVTASGFDTGVTYPRTGQAHWYLRTGDALSFWTYAINNTPIGFQGNQPVVVVKTATGRFTYTPSGQFTTNNAWSFHRVPLAGSSRWLRASTGTPTLTDINQIEIHQDTWDYGFTIYYDGLRFEVTQPSPPTLAVAPWSGGSVRLTLRGDSNLPHIVEASPDMGQWTAVRTNIPLGGVVEWTEAISGRRFFRAKVP
jgi:subtilisin-like proprotein convertase family protein